MVTLGGWPQDFPSMVRQKRGYALVEAWCNLMSQGGTKKKIMMNNQYHLGFKYEYMYIYIFDYYVWLIINPTKQSPATSVQNCFISTYQLWDRYPWSPSSRAGLKQPTLCALCLWMLWLFHPQHLPRWWTEVWQLTSTLGFWGWVGISSFQVYDKKGGDCYVHCFLQTRSLPFMPSGFIMPPMRALNPCNCMKFVPLHPGSLE